MCRRQENTIQREHHKAIVTTMAKIKGKERPSEKCSVKSIYLGFCLFQTGYGLESDEERVKSKRNRPDSRFIFHWRKKRTKENFEVAVTRQYCRNLILCRRQENTLKGERLT